MSGSALDEALRLGTAPAMEHSGVNDRSRLVIYGAEKELEVSGCRRRLNTEHFSPVET